MVLDDAAHDDGEGGADPTGPVNAVVLRGRLAAPVQERTLPSGDLLATFRLIVARPPTSRSGAPTVDTLDCVVWAAALRRSTESWRPGDVVEVHGALRRRFWRSESGPASRCEVEVTDGRRVGKAS
jgi:single-strand DNA-binding protein